MDTKAINVGVTRIPSQPGVVAGLKCPGCHDRLVVHQPEDQWPERLLGICPRCRGWFLVHVPAWIMIRLPDERDLPET